MNLDLCKRGKHSLIVVYYEGSDENRAQPVVRWCEDCGAVVVDVDFDGRTHPGRLMQMKVPNVSRS